MSRFGQAQTEGSSLLEIVLVVTSIAILAAVSVPRMSQASRMASDSTVTGGLAALRSAIDRYSAEHGGAFPTAAEINRQLTQYTDLTGTVSETRTLPYVYGPYVRCIPALPVGVRRGNSRIAASDGKDVGWLYTEASGKITANTTTEMDETQGLYKNY
ncbi:MAG: type II secretion system protein [Phycisphaerales bacterium]